jgi:TetR/AcrR family transcriptional regulator, cholesterol catabolism regulator
MFDERGYYAVSMEDIAAAVGLRKPSLYHHVRSKDEILALIHQEFMQLVISRQVTRARAPMTPGQRLLEVMADILELMRTHRGHVRVFFEHYRDLSEEDQRRIRLERDRYESMVEDILRDGIERGDLRPVDVRLATLAVFGTCNWAYQWYRREGKLDTRAIAYTFWDIFWRGLAAGNPGNGGETQIRR